MKHRFLLVTGYLLLATFSQAQNFVTVSESDVQTLWPEAGGGTGLFSSREQCWYADQLSGGRRWAGD